MPSRRLLSGRVGARPDHPISGPSVRSRRAHCPAHGPQRAAQLESRGDQLLRAERSACHELFFERLALDELHRQAGDVADPLRAMDRDDVRVADASHQAAACVAHVADRHDLTNVDAVDLHPRLAADAAGIRKVGVILCGGNVNLDKLYW